MAQTPTTKRGMIDKANSTILVMTAIAAFVVVFSFFACKALFSQAAYQNRVIGAKRTANEQLQKDVVSVKNLDSSYEAFVGTSQNVIGGNPAGTGDRDGDNAKIILDALPSKYDFPALATSLEKILTSQNVNIDKISGTDDQLNQGNNSGSATPAPIAMPFTASVDGAYPDIQNVINTFEKSIRPFQFQTVELTASQSKITLSVSAQTYYQPEKTFTVSTKVVK